MWVKVLFRPRWDLDTTSFFLAFRTMSIRTDLSRFLTKAIYFPALILHLSPIEMAFSSLAILNREVTALMVNISQEGDAGATIPTR